VGAAPPPQAGTEVPPVASSPALTSAALLGLIAPATNRSLWQHMLRPTTSKHSLRVATLTKSQNRQSWCERLPY
jgi:hypothetical protein